MAAALKAEIERLSRCADNAGGTGANQRIVGSFRPCGYRPPAAIQLLRLLEIRSGNDHRTPISSAGNGVSEGNRYASAAQNRSDGRQSIVGQALSVPGDHDDVGAVLAKLAAQLGLDIHVKVEHGGGHGGGDHHGQQSRSGAATPQNGGAHTACAGTSKCGARLRGAGRRGWYQASSSVTSQRVHRIKLYRPPDRGRAAGKSHQHGDGQNDGQEHRLDGDLRSEDGVSDLAGQQRAAGEARGSGQQGQQRSLGKKQDGHGQIAGAQRLHQAHLAAPLHHRSRHRSGNRQRGGQQRRQRDQEHQSLDARKHRAFILRHLANLLGVGVRDGLLQLECDGLRVRRAVPAVVHLRRHAFGIAAGERVFGFGHGADVDAAHRAGLAENLLRQRKRRDDLIIFRPAGGENAGDAVRVARNFNLLSRRSV